MLMWKRGLGISQYEGIVSPAYSVFEFIKGLPRYYHYLFRTDLYVSEFRRNSRGVIESRLRLYDDEFGFIYSHFPPIADQQSIVTFLDDKTSQIDSLISNSQKKIELLKEKRTALINHAVTKGLDPKAKMKDSGVEWIGEAPNNWRIIKLKYLVGFPKNQVGVESFKNIEVVHYSIPNVQSYGVGVLEHGGDIDSSKILLTGNELIISKLNPRKSTIAIVIPSTYTILASGEFVVIKPFSIDKYLLFYLLSTKSYTGFLDSQTESVTRSHQRVSPDVIYNSLIALPSLTEQKDIVEYLDHHTSEIDKEVSLEERRIELLKEYRQSLISEVVTGKINVSDYAVQSN
jgi:type I restriction enzyme S subunit